MSRMQFNILAKEIDSQARVGEIETAHGVIKTPAFMPVGTKGCVKAVTNRQLHDLDAHIILGNTYHLMLKPGQEIIKQAGGLHKFMNWSKPILTDSGGFQVFSLSHLNKVTEEGVHFKSHIDGSKHFLGPTESMCIQKNLGSDIVTAFDECTHFPCEKSEAEQALEKTTRWAKTCRNYELMPHQNLFGIVQGSVYPDLRAQSAKKLVSMDFDGYAIGGLAVGEPKEMMNDMINFTVPHLPEKKPRYLMGVGTPRNLIEAVMRGIDMFDCVMPTRNARNGTAFTWDGKLIIKSARYTKDFNPLDSQTSSYTSHFSRAYLRHLLNVDEITGLTLITIHNLAFYLDFMNKIRQSIFNRSLNRLYKQICSIYPI